MKTPQNTSLSRLQQELASAAAKHGVQARFSGDELQFIVPTGSGEDAGYSVQRYGFQQLTDKTFALNGNVFGGERRGFMKDITPGARRSPTSEGQMTAVRADSVDPLKQFGEMVQFGMTNPSRFRSKATEYMQPMQSLPQQKFSDIGSEALREQLTSTQIFVDDYERRKMLGIQQVPGRSSISRGFEKHAQAYARANNLMIGDSASKITHMAMDDGQDRGGFTSLSAITMTSPGYISKMPGAFESGLEGEIGIYGTESSITKLEDNPYKLAKRVRSPRDMMSARTIESAAVPFRSNGATNIAYMKTGVGAGSAIASSTLLRSFGVTPASRKSYALPDAADLTSFGLSLDNAGTMVHEGEEMRYSMDGQAMAFARIGHDTIGEGATGYQGTMVNPKTMELSLGYNAASRAMLTRALPQLKSEIELGFQEGAYIEQDEGRAGARATVMRALGQFEGMQGVSLSFGGNQYGDTALKADVYRLASARADKGSGEKTYYNEDAKVSSLLDTVRVASAHSFDDVKMINRGGLMQGLIQTQDPRYRGVQQQFMSERGTLGDEGALNNALGVMNTEEWRRGFITQGGGNPDDFPELPYFAPFADRGITTEYGTKNDMKMSLDVFKTLQQQSPRLAELVRRDAAGKTNPYAEMHWSMSNVPAQELSLPKGGLQVAYQAGMGVGSTRVALEQLQEQTGNLARSVGGNSLPSPEAMQNFAPNSDLVNYYMAAHGVSELTVGSGDAARTMTRGEAAKLFREKSYEKFLSGENAESFKKNIASIDIGGGTYNEYSMHTGAADEFQFGPDVAQRWGESMGMTAQQVIQASKEKGGLTGIGMRVPNVGQDIAFGKFQYNENISGFAVSPEFAIASQGDFDGDKMMAWVNSFGKGEGPLTERQAAMETAYENYMKAGGTEAAALKTLYSLGGEDAFNAHLADTKSKMPNATPEQLRRAMLRGNKEAKVEGFNPNIGSKTLGNKSAGNPMVEARKDTEAKYEAGLKGAFTAEKKTIGEAHFSAGSIAYADSKKQMGIKNTLDILQGGLATKQEAFNQAFSGMGAGFNEVTGGSATPYELTRQSGQAAYQVAVDAGRFDASFSAVAAEFNYAGMSGGDVTTKVGKLAQKMAIGLASEESFPDRALAGLMSTGATINEQAASMQSHYQTIQDLRRRGPEYLDQLRVPEGSALYQASAAAILSNSRNNKNVTPEQRAQLQSMAGEATGIAGVVQRNRQDEEGYVTNLEENDPIMAQTLAENAKASGFAHPTMGEGMDSLRASKKRQAARQSAAESTRTAPHFEYRDFDESEIPQQSDEFDDPFSGQAPPPSRPGFAAAKNNAMGAPPPAAGGGGAAPPPPRQPPTAQPAADPGSGSSRAKRAGALGRAPRAGAQQAVGMNGTVELGPNSLAAIQAGGIGGGNGKRPPFEGGNKYSWALGDKYTPKAMGMTRILNEMMDETGAPTGKRLGDLMEDSGFQEDFRNAGTSEQAALTGIDEFLGGNMPRSARQELMGKLSHQAFGRRDITPGSTPNAAKRLSSMFGQVRRSLDQSPEAEAKNSIAFVGNAMAQLAPHGDESFKQAAAALTSATKKAAEFMDKFGESGTEVIKDQKQMHEVLKEGHEIQKEINQRGTDVLQAGGGIKGVSGVVKAARGLAAGIDSMTSEGGSLGEEATTRFGKDFFDKSQAAIKGGGGFNPSRLLSGFLAFQLVRAGRYSFDPLLQSAEGYDQQQQQQNRILAQGGMGQTFRDTGAGQLRMAGANFQYNLGQKADYFARGVSAIDRALGISSSGALSSAASVALPAIGVGLGSSALLSAFGVAAAAPIAAGAAAIAGTGAAAINTVGAIQSPTAIGQFVANAQKQGILQAAVSDPFAALGMGIKSLNGGFSALAPDIAQAAMYSVSDKQVATAGSGKGFPLQTLKPDELRRFGERAFVGETEFSKAAGALNISTPDAQKALNTSIVRAGKSPWKFSDYQKYLNEFATYGDFSLSASKDQLAQMQGNYQPFGGNQLGDMSPADVEVGKSNIQLMGGSGNLALMVQAGMYPSQELARADLAGRFGKNGVLDDASALQIQTESQAGQAMKKAGVSQLTLKNRAQIIGFRAAAAGVTGGEYMQMQQGVAQRVAGNYSNAGFADQLGPLDYAKETQRNQNFQMMGGGGTAQMANAMGVGMMFDQAVNASSLSPTQAQTMASLSMGDPLSITQAGAMGVGVGAQIGAMTDLSTGGGLFQRSMYGLNGFGQPSNQQVSSWLQNNAAALSNGARIKSLNPAGSAFNTRMTQAMQGQTFNIGGQAIGGMAGLGMLSNQVNYEAAMASAGSQIAQIKEGFRYYSEVQLPSQRSDLGMDKAEAFGGFYQDDFMKSHGISGVDFGKGKFARQREAFGRERAGAIADMSAQTTRLGWQIEDVNKEQARTNVQNNWQREDFGLKAQSMQLARGFQNYQFQFQAREMSLNKQYANQDFAYNRQVSNLQYGWQQEDYDTNIRRSTGFQRRQLVKERDRSTQMHNLEVGQEDKLKARQDEGFKRQEEYFKKQVDNYRANARLEDKQFDNEKKRFEQQAKWRDEDFNTRRSRIQQEMRWLAESHARQMENLKAREEELKIEEDKAKSNFEKRTAMMNEDEKHQIKMKDLAIAAAGAAAEHAKKQKEIQDAYLGLQTTEENRFLNLQKLVQDVGWDRVAAAVEKLVLLTKMLPGGGGFAMPGGPPPPPGPGGAAPLGPPNPNQAPPHGPGGATPPPQGRDDGDHQGGGRSISNVRPSSPDEGAAEGGNQTVTVLLDSGVIAQGVFTKGKTKATLDARRNY